MNRLLKYICLCSILFVFNSQTILAADNDDGYTLTTEVKPAGVGSVRPSGSQVLLPGATVSCSTSRNNSNYTFQYWCVGDSIVSLSSSFTFTMPSHDALLTAVYKYNPSNPNNPDMPVETYALSLQTTPSGAGSFNTNSLSNYEAGTQVYLRAYNNTGYEFVCWLEDKDTLSKSAYCYYTMPERDASLTAVYRYNPSSPANPDTMAVKRFMYLESQPAGAGSFNWSTPAEILAGQNVSVYAYTNTGWRFREWQKDGQTVSTDYRYYFAMPASDIRLVAVYDYNPSSPANPGRNYWNSETGEVIVDDFEPGYLNSTIYNLVGSYSKDVTMITVAGRVNSGDWYVVSNFSGCTLLDMSRTTGMTSVPSWTFEYNSTLTSVVLPASIEMLESYSFYHCESLQSITCYALTPPTIGYSAFEGVADGIVVYVPAAAVGQYQESDGWQDFTILPLQDEVSALEVNLPDGVDPSIYKDMYIELINTKSGQKQRYVITNRTTYTFSSLIHNTQYNVYLRNQQGDVLGQINGVDVKMNDVSVTFASLKVPRTLKLQVLAPDGDDVTDQASITWSDDKGNYLSRGNTLGNMLEGKKVQYRIGLSQQLGMQYLLPEDSQYEVQADNDIVVNLAPIPQTTISGVVRDIKTSQPLNGAIVSVSQMLNGLYSKSFTVKTDNQGKWSLQVFEAKTDITASMTDYVSKSQSYETLVTEIPAFDLKDINGTTISLNLTYQSTDGETQNYYSDYANVAYEVYNQSTGQQITGFNVQYPQIVLIEQLPEGTILHIKAVSKNGKFVPIEGMAVVDNLNRTSVTLPIKQLGGIMASFAQTDNTNVTGILYDANGRLVKKYDYTSATLIISELLDGAYTLVTMANSLLFNSIASLTQFREIGLKEGVDYVKNNVTVTSGEMTLVDNQLIPFLDEAKLYYTGNNTSFTVNKTQVTAGQYLTLSSRIDFKAAYAKEVSDVSLIVDLPEESSFVDNSVMVGNAAASYTLSGRRVIIPLSNYGDRIRFCFIPMVGGDFSSVASVQFTMGGKTITQPMGNANFKVTNLSINVPSTIVNATMSVSGTANAKSSVDVYDNGTLIGHTTSIANGTWVTNCELNNPYNLSMHNIYAKVTTEKGVELISETKQVLYDISNIVPEKVTMLYYNQEFDNQYNIVFDLVNGTVTPSSYYFFPYKNWPNWWETWETEPKDFTFVVDLTNNDTTVVSGVTIRVYTVEGTWRNLEAKYNTSMKKWVAVSQFREEELPAGVTVDYVANSEFVADRNQLSDDLSVSNDAYASSIEEREEFEKEIEVTLPNQSVYDSIHDIVSADSIDVSRLYEELIKLVSPGDSINYDVDALCASVDELVDSVNVLDIEADEAFASLLDDWYPQKDKTFSSDDDIESPIEALLGQKIISRTKLSSIDDTELIEDGFEQIQLTDGSFVFVKVDSISRSIIDGNTLIKYEERIVFDNDSIQANSRRFISSNLQHCINGFKMAVMQLQKTIETNGESMDEGKIRHYIAVLSSVVKDLGELLQCVYENSFVAITQKLDEKADLLAAPLKKSEEKLLNKVSEIEAAMASEASYNNTLNNLRNNQIDFIDELNVKFAIAETREEKKLIEEQIAFHQQLKNSYTNQLNESGKRIGKLTEKYNKLQKELAENAAKLAKRLEVVEKSRIFLRKVPVRLTDARMLKGFKIAGNAGKVIGTTVGALLQMIPLWIDCYDYSESLLKWGDLWGKIIAKLPCEGNESEMNKFVMASAAATYTSVKAGASTLKAEAAALVLDVTNVPHAWLASLALDIYSWVIGGANNWFTDKSREIIENNLSKIKCGNDKCPRCGKKPCECKDKCPRCGKKPCTCPDKCPKCGKNPCVCPPPFPRIDPIHDPSGYVYEGVTSNRVQGVTATVYYKEEVEDMYGDLHENVVLWNAEEYAQENPLFTDENGMYRWDVPQGLWQVKFEKEGYQTTYSDWLPVPPPQLDVNIAMTQLRQPSVTKANAYDEGVEIEFDKYMDPETLTSDNIKVTRNGNAVEGTLELLNEETAYEGQTQTYASKVRFNVPGGEELLSTDEVQLTVSRKVKSYAGIPMEEDFIQSFSVEPRVRKISVDSLINIAYGGERTLKVAALPAEASKGKKMMVKSLSTMIVTSSATELILDDNGEAELKVVGELPGSTVMTFEVEETDVEGQMKINVKDATQLVTVAPRASRVSGTQVYRGTEIRLTTETEGATIYYTLDGTCPCNVETALKYNPEEPIVIASDEVVIKAMAQGHDLAESEVSEFTYSLKKTALGYNMPEGWTWISHNLEESVPVSSFQTNAERIISQTREVVNDPVVGLVGNLTELQPAEAYKVKVSGITENRLQGYEWNAALNSVPVEVGWNWIGYPVNQVMTLAEALAFHDASEGDYVVGQDGYAEFTDGEWKGSLEGLKPGQGFLYKSAVNADILFNTTIVSQAVNRIGMRNYLIDSPWAPAKHAYPNVMPLTAQLYDGGLNIGSDDYVVGAFADSECRGVGIWKDNVLMMNVYGQSGENIRFVAKQLSTDQYFDLTEQMSYATDNVGTFNAPYKLTIGDLSTDIAKVNDGLTVTPVVAHSYITVTAGGKDINYLTLTNMGGQMVVSLSDLGKGATVTLGQLPEGMYVVTVQAGGQSYYRKIMKANK